MTVFATQLGVKDETTYGTPVTVDRFFEYNSESVSLEMGRMESAATRAGTRVQRSDRFAVYRQGAAGDIELEVLTKGFGWWLKHMLGAVATGVVNADGRYTHTGTIASLTGDFFTAQLNRPFNPSGSDQAFTYHGGKVASWELSNDAEGLLMAKMSCDFEDEDTSTALATASYPASMEHFSFVGGACTVASTAFEVTGAKVACENGLKTGRRFLRSSGLKKEPIEDSKRNITFELGAEFRDLTQYNRVVSATAAGAVAEIVLTWQGPTLIAGTSYPELVVTLPAARFDSAPVNVSGDEALTHTISGRGLFDGTNSAVKIEYKSVDATP